MLVTAEGSAVRNWVDLLEAEGFAVDVLSDGSEADARLAGAPPDLVLLDVLLPGLSGHEICRRARSRDSTSLTPIIFVTALGDEADRVRGLDAGADDYIVTPFSPREFVARLRSVLRRVEAYRIGADIITVGDIEVDCGARRVRRAGRTIHLGPIEFALLEYMVQRRGRVISRAQFKQGIWGSATEIIDRAVDVNIGRLRRALSAPGERDPIRTIRSLGYQIEDDDS